jgi:signal transduction histidine kinase
LRGRLLAALLLVILAFWGLGAAWHLTQMDREKHGWWDGTLRMIGQQILLSLPANTGQLAAERPYELPEGTQYAVENLSFQVWSHDGRLVLRSPDAPGVPLRAGMAEGYANTVVEGQPWRVYSVSDATGRMHVQVGRSQEQMQAQRATWLKASVVISLMVLALFGFPLWFVICWSLQPVTEVQDAIQRRHALDFAPLPVGGLPHEVAPMVESFNRLLQRLDVAVQGERRFIADAAHELRTPLAALLAQSELALRADDPSQSRAALVRLKTVVERSSRLVEQLLDLARLDAGDANARMRRVALYECVEVVVRDFEAMARHKGQRIQLELDAGELMGDVDALGILLRNLVDNALRYTAAGGRVVVRCAESGGEVLLRVADDGPGVPSEERGRIFDRFYRVAGNGERGSGIGLSLVARIAQLHGARIEVAEGIDGRGFGITLRFRAAEAAVAPRHEDRPSPRHAAVDATAS